MHLTLKQEATKPAAANVLQQQARFDDVHRRSTTRSGRIRRSDMKVPADVYARSPRVYRGLEELDYPFHDGTFTVTQCGRICFKGRKVNLSHVFAGQNVGVTQVGERIWLVTFMRLRFGLLRRRDVPARTDRQSVRPESVTHVSGMNCHPCVRNGPSAIINDCSPLLIVCAKNPTKPSRRVPNRSSASRRPNRLRQSVFGNYCGHHGQATMLPYAH